MFSLLKELHFWSTNEDLAVKSTDFSAFKYSSRKEPASDVYANSKRVYAEQRGYLCIPRNNRRNKLKDRLKELEDHLSHYKVVCLDAHEERLRLVLQQGLLVDITVNVRTADVVNISFDKVLASKLQNELVVDAVIHNELIVCLLNDGRLLGCTSCREPWIYDLGYISTSTSNALSSGQSVSSSAPFTAIRRNLSIHGEWLVLWGKQTADHPQPWSPLAKEHQRANVHLYWLNATRVSTPPELLAYRRTEGDPISIVVSRKQARSLLVVEQKVSQRGSVSIELTHLELHSASSALRRLGIVAIPLQTQVSCTALSPNERHLFLGCIDGSLALLDRLRGSTRIIRTAFIPTFLVWHHNDDDPLISTRSSAAQQTPTASDNSALCAVLSDRGHLNYYDLSLNAVQYQLVENESNSNSAFDFGEYLPHHRLVSMMHWRGKYLFVAFEGGPLAVLNFLHEMSLSYRSLVSSYLRMGNVDRAIALLTTSEFGVESFQVLQQIVNYLLRRPLNDTSAKQLQNAFGVYYCPPTELSNQSRHKFGSQVKSMTRRFFHQLVRHHQFEMAFLLAVDLGHHDLFMDLHFIAVTLGHTEMAAAARAQAEALLSRCSSVSSNCSRSSCSQCSHTSGSSSSGSSNSDAHASPESPQQADTAATEAASALLSDNYLSTNFNTPIPKTYKASVNIASMPLIDLPKIQYPKPPISTTTVNAKHAPGLARPLISVPALSYIPEINQDIGIPILDDFNPQFSYISSISTSNARSFPSLTKSFANATGNMMNSPLYLNNLPSQPSDVLPSARYGRATTTILDDRACFTPIRPLLPPPLPTVSSYIPSMTTKTPRVLSPAVVPNLITPIPPLPLPTTAAPNVSGGITPIVRKPQAKVKFSDTVTAFIVPEVKRPVRPPPPAHVTDPQKELADSLPLCHPNEDYLKDFAPIKRNDDDMIDMTTPTSDMVEEMVNDSVDASKAPTAPKIKVVHFGLV